MHPPKPCEPWCKLGLSILNTMPWSIHEGLIASKSSTRKTEEQLQAEQQMDDLSAFKFLFAVLSGLLLVLFLPWVIAYWKFIENAPVWDTCSLAFIVSYLLYCILSCTPVLRGRVLVVSGIAMHIGLAVLATIALVKFGNGFFFVVSILYGIMWAIVCVGRVNRENPKDVVGVSEATDEIEASSSPKWRRRTVAAAPLRLGCPAGYSGCDGVITSGSQPGSEVVSLLPSLSASGIEVTGRQVTELISPP